MRLILSLLLSAFSSPVLATCLNPLEIRISAAVPAYGSASFNYKNPYGPPHVWSFPQTVPAGEEWHILDLYFMDKFIPNQQSSYATLDGVFTMTTHAPYLHFRHPIKITAGFTLTGQFANGTSSGPTNMIFGMHICRVTLP